MHLQKDQTLLSGAQGVKVKVQQIQAQYYGTLTDGSMFDNSFQRGTPFRFAVGTGQVIKGWDEGFALLPEGSKATFFIPASLGYGASDRPKIPGNSELVFYVEVEKVGR